MALPLIAAAGLRAIGGQIAKKAGAQMATKAVAGTAGEAAASSGAKSAVMRSAQMFGRGLSMGEFGGSSSGSDTMSANPTASMGGQAYNTAQHTASNLLGSSAQTTLDDNDQSRFG